MPDAADPDNGSACGGKDGEVVRPAAHSCGFMDHDANNSTLGHCNVHARRQSREWLLRQRYHSVCEGGTVPCFCVAAGG